jgi:MtN3 and saliva related transmembrane protein
MATSVLAVAAATWGVIMALSPVLQIRRMVVRRSSEDVSIGYFGVLMFGFALWLFYGASIDNATLVVPNSVALLVGAVTVGVAMWFRRSARASRDRD